MDTFAHTHVRFRHTLVAAICASLLVPALALAAEPDLAAIQRAVAGQHDA